MGYPVGIDVGSASAEALILKDGKILAYSILETGANSRKAAEKALEEALKKAGISRTEVGPIVATGYGRISVDFASRQVTEISCYARGISFLYPEVKMVIDIGGQDSKAILVGKNGRVLDFVMNDKCAAGTGRFLEVMAKAMEVNVEELGEISLRSRNPAEISSTCTVFAESEVVSLIAKGVPVEDIAAGIHKAIARRVGAMARRIGVVPPVAFAGGVAKNVGVVRALEEELGVKLIVPEEPQIIGALGAALLATEE
jgi:predicted CoA-substrate-specific enzyme activase